LPNLDGGEDREVFEKERKREKESVFIPNGESLETTTLHGSVSGYSQTQKIEIRSKT
jgi:hypothetical protein